MSEIVIEQQQYKTYLLSDDEAQIAVVPERGGIVTHWQVEGEELFYLDSDRFKDPALTVRGGIPLLFPICGNLAGDTYSLNEQPYKLPPHGFARNLPWQVTDQATDTGASLTVSLKSNETTRSSYPFDFELNYTYTLRGNSLELRCRHTNLSDQPMPFSTGIHPYFAVTDKSQLTVDFPSTQYQSKGAAEDLNFPGHFDFEQEEIDFSFINLQGRSATVADKSRNLKLTVEYDEHYSTLVFWAVKGKNFYCLEPWTAPRNALNTGKNLLVAEPAACIETVIKMTAEVG
ncbi:MAG: aldose epimerase [Timaviella obliquedivisa GSE-PSE-MK23-08B]|jgi:galactose mutarotase-like enzyme|nr:aldose epimerase [Timaviella obliquedivisa GSE-PSE-MK23-08B]